MPCSCRRISSFDVEPRSYATQLADDATSPTNVANLVTSNITTPSPALMLNKLYEIVHFSTTVFTLHSARKRRPGRHRRIDTASCELLGLWLSAQPDRTLTELTERLQAASGLTASMPTMCRVLQRLGPCRKKTVHATERDTAQVCQAHRQYRQKIAYCASTRLKFIDESSVNIPMKRRLWPCPSWPART